MLKRTRGYNHKVRHASYHELKRGGTDSETLGKMEKMIEDATLERKLCIMMERTNRVNWLCSDE